MTAEIRDPAAGFSLRPPQGWEAGRDGNRVALAPPGGNSFVVAFPHAASEREELRPLLEEGWTERGLELRPTGPPASGDGWVAVALAGKANEREVTGALLGMFSPYRGGLLVVGIAPLGEDVRSLVDAVAEEVRFFRPDPAALVHAWRERLTGRKLTYLSQYSSISGGIEERHELVLHPDGRFEQEGDLVAALGDEGSAVQRVAPPSGQWRLEVVAGRPILVLEGDVGAPEYVLAEERGEVFLNGRRYLVTEWR